MVLVSTVVRSYKLKVGDRNELQQGINYLLELASLASKSLLKELWTEEWVALVGTSAKKAYKVVNERQVQLIYNGVEVYLPSRIRRSIAEIVGRVLRSQYERLSCYQDIQEVVAVTGVERNLDNLVRKVAYTLQVFKGRYYRWSLIRQTLRMMRKYHYKLGLDLQMVDYLALVQPRIRTIVFPYGSDDDQAIKVSCDGKTISYRIKLPTTAAPVSRSDWKWYEESLTIPRKIQRKLSKAKQSAPKRPDLRLFRLKGGLEVPVLQFAYEIINEKLDYTHYNKRRVLAVDVGLAHLLTSVVCEAGSQVTPPMFYNDTVIPVRKIDRIYEQIGNLQRKLKRYPQHMLGQTRRRQELSRLYAKLGRYRNEHVYLLIKELLRQAARYGCLTIAVEDLRHLHPPKGRGRLSRRLSNWLRGRLVDLLKDKAKELGIRVKAVPPYGTSSYCPRCGAKGIKVASPSSTLEESSGRYFYCPACVFRADRDYVGALNIYRVYRFPRNCRYRLSSAPAIFYQKVVLPPDRPGGVPLAGD